MVAEHASGLQAAATKGCGPQIARPVAVTSQMHRGV